jgi:MSHA biogenesis protein MshQ
MIFTKLVRASSWWAAILWAMLLAAPLAAQAATDNFNGGAVANCTLTPALVYNCSALSTSNNIIIASGYTVALTGSINFDYNQQLNMSGTARLTTTGSLDIGNISPSNLNITGGSLAAGTSFKIGAQAQTIVADVSAASMVIGTGSATRITGTLTSTGPVALASHVTIVGAISGTAISTNSPVDLTGDVTASSAFQLASGSHMVGNITAPSVAIDPSSVTVNGNIAASSALSIGSGNTVNGNVSGGSLSMASSNVVINGNVTMTADVSMGASDTINGDLVARNVSTASSDDYISGNASVNTIELDWHAHVGKTITCTGAGASGCSCVTNNSGYTSGPNAPVCGASTPTTAHHILVTHPGTALTCQPQTVSITACANAACSAPNYTGTISVTLAPGNQTFTVTGGTNNAATIQQTATGAATISATSAGVSNASTCLRTSDGSSSCAVTFATAGLEMLVADHKAGETPSFSLRALQANSSNTACVALLANTTQSVNFKCGYQNPSSTNPAYPAAPSINSVGLGAGNSTAAACSSGGANVNVAFNSSGVASPSLLYNDAGSLNLTASLTPAGLQAMTKSVNFTVAPYQFKFTAVQGTTANPQAADETGGVFIGAGQLFTTTMAAVTKTGTTTRNFGREATPEYVGTVTPTLIAPIGGAFPGLKNSTGGAIAFPAMTNAESALSMYYNEVGIVSLSAYLQNPGGYLGSGMATSGTTNIGRFIPDHFDTTITSLLMDCTKVTGTNKPCPAPNAGGKFLYARQPFDISVTAYSANNTRTTNYAGLYAKAVAVEVWNAATPTTLQNPPAAPSGNSLTWQKRDGSAGTGTGFAASDFAGGLSASTYDPTVSSVDRHPQYNFAAIYPAASSALAAPVSAYLRAKDTDGATSLRTTAPATAGEALVSFVSGRSQVNNVYGSPTANAPVKVNAQYWSGSAYVNNPAYASPVSTTLASSPTAGAGNVVFLSCQLKASAPGASSTGCATSPSLPAGASLNFSGGEGSFYIAPMSQAGWVDLQLVQPTSPTGVAKGIFDYLPSTSGRATFGVYRAGPVVYLREVF